MSYWILTNQMRYPEYHAHISGLLIDPEGKINPSPFGMGRKLGKKDAPYKIKPDDLSIYGKYTDRLTVTIQGRENLFVVSESFADFLMERKINAEFFDVEFTEDMPPIKYKIVNILDIIDCVDEDESHLIYKDLSYSEILTIDKLVIDYSKIPNNMDMFLLGKTAFPVIVISQRLKERIEENNFTGFSIIPPSKLIM